MAVEEEEDIALWTDEIQGTLTMNWHDIVTAMQNETQMEVPYLQGRGNQQTMKRATEGKIWHFLFRNSDSTTRVACDMKKLQLLLLMTCEYTHISKR